MNGRLMQLSVAVATVAFLVVGCGGGDDETALTKAQFIKQADAICKKADVVQGKALVKLEEEKKMEDRPKAEQGELTTTVGLEPMLEEAEGIAELPAPEGDEAEIEAIVSAIEAGVKRARSEPDVFVSQEGPDYFAEADKLARKYGMKACSEVI